MTTAGEAVEEGEGVTGEGKLVGLLEVGLLEGKEEGAGHAMEGEALLPLLLTLGDSTESRTQEPSVSLCSASVLRSSLSMHP
jgi:hypothetical protein